ncbi:antibiotic biosynthesis monooxygenase family protein, partial [Escherichia coli]|uniref:antibiotic biosynthesis monooxygenase family protein n=2 Tax=Enterobacteriaceae TaxID=543 RepID=UPI001FCEC685
MIAVIFEVQIQPDQQTRYLTLAEELRPLLSHVAGFISIERFQSLATEGKMLSLSWWENEYAVLMNPLMILVKIIKLRWIHILSYDQMVSRKINNQTTRCANSI